MLHIDYCEIDFWDGYFRTYCAGFHMEIPFLLEYITQDNIDIKEGYTYPEMTDRQQPGEGVSTKTTKLTVFEDIWHAVYNPGKEEP